MPTPKPKKRPFLVPEPGAGGVELADWAEATMFLNELPTFSRADIRGRLRITADDDPDIEIDQLLSEVQHREATLNDRYPFTRELSGIARKPAMSVALYEFLLLLSFSPLFRKSTSRLATADRLFDNVVRDAVRAYLGETADAVRFAWPSSEKRPKAFPAAITWLAERINQPEGGGDRRPAVKDGGVDVAGWRNFRDGRTAFPILLVQATVQPEGAWLTKATNVVLTKWMGWVDTGVPGLSALAVPFVIGRGYAAWDELRRTVALVLDRIRLMELLPANHVDAIDELRKWTENEQRVLTAAAA